MTDDNGTTDDTKARWQFGLLAVCFGIVAILAALIIVITQFNTAADVAAVLGAVVSPIATIVAAYFGIQAGSAGKAAADANMQKAHETAIVLAAAAEPGAATEALNRMKTGG